MAAAKAYDKAAVYLYGSNAITNFGLEACQVDPTEVRTCCKLAVHTAALRGMYQTYSYLCHPSDVAIAPSRTCAAPTTAAFELSLRRRLPSWL